MDIETRRVVRELRGFKNKVLDVVRAICGKKPLRNIEPPVDLLSRREVAYRHISRLRHTDI